MSQNKEKWKYLAIPLLLAIAVAGFMILKPKPLIPEYIRKQISFVVIYPDKTSQASVDSSSVKYDPEQRNLSFKASIASTGLTISEQATPENFTDIPQLYDKTVEAMKPYATIDTKQGKVSLTRPDKSNNNQVGVLNNHGTLMFVRASQDLSNDQWRQFYNSLELISP